MSLTYARGHTRASAMAKSHITQENFTRTYSAFQNYELFKMSKFKNINPRTNTHNAKKTLAKVAKYV